MGNWIASIFGGFKEEKRILMLGLDAAVRFFKRKRTFEL